GANNLRAICFVPTKSQRRRCDCGGSMKTELTITMRKIIALLEDGRLSASTLAGVCDLKVSALSSALRQQRYLGAQTEANVHTRALRSLNVLDALKPLTITPGDWSTLKKLVDSDLTPEEMRQKIASLSHEFEQ